MSKRVEVYDVSYVPFQKIFLHFENKAQTTTPSFTLHLQKTLRKFNTTYVYIPGSRLSK